MGKKCTGCDQPAEGKRLLCADCVEELDEAISIAVYTLANCPVCDETNEYESVERGVVKCEHCKSLFKTTMIY